MKLSFDLNQCIEILDRTPEVLNNLLKGLSDSWLMTNEGKDTWSPYDVLGHLIVGEETDWMVRIKIIKSDSENKQFEPFDRFAQKNKTPKSINELLKQFTFLRKQNLNELKSLNLTEQDFKLTGIHPDFGSVTLQQLISAWTVHDLGHLAQISRVMAKNYKNDVGPWINYLGILKK